MDSFFIKISYFLILLFIIFHSIPSTISLSRVSISENSNFTIVCALIPGLNSQQSILNCSTFPLQTHFRVNSSLSFSGLVSGDGFLCGLTTFYSNSVSAMVCWRFSGGNNIVYKRIYQGPVINDLEAGNSHFCGLVNGTNRLECWQWPGFVPNSISSYSSIAVGEGFVCGISQIGAITCEGSNGNVGNVVRDVPNGNFSVIGAGFRHACAIGVGDELACWGESGGWPSGRFMDMALGENRSCALQTNGLVVCWGQSNFSLPVNLRGMEFLSIEAKRNVFCGVARLNFSLYCWGTENFDSNIAVFREVLPGSCRRNGVCRCGSIPGSGRFCQEGYSICEPCESDVAPPPVTPPSWPPLPQPSKSEWNGRMIAFLVVGCVGSSAFLVVAGFFLFRYCMFKSCRVHDSGRIDEPGALEQGVSLRENSQARQASRILDKRLSQLASMGNAGQLEEYSLQELLEATNNFSEAQKIGTGSFGSVYHGLLEDGREVAIKRAEVTSTSSYAIVTKRQEDKDNAFINELESLSRLHHKNLVRLLGFCEDSNERVLVYEFMQNGNLHDHLHKLQNSPLMSWPARIKVALDAARGIEYLHEYAVPPIIHRDIKSSNILLDESWTAKVSDFGLSLMGPQEDESHLSLRAAGTVGYMDPEYYRLQKLTTKSDVYSFGVILLELLSGHKAIHKNENGVPRNVVDFVVPYIVQDDIHRVLDKRVPPPTPYEIEAVSYVGYLAADCVMLESKDRPSMSEIVNSLERALAACLVHPTSLSRSTTGSST